MGGNTSPSSFKKPPSVKMSATTSAQVSPRTRQASEYARGVAGCGSPPNIEERADLEDLVDGEQMNLNQATGESVEGALMTEPMLREENGLPASTMDSKPLSVTSSERKYRNNNNRVVLPEKGACRSMFVEREKAKAQKLRKEE